MATVSSLDKDLRSMRLDKYTPGRAKETRQWIEETLGERLKAGDVMEALKDGTALCKLINLAAPGTVRYKESAMPFVQMENISHFLRASQQPPFNLPAHDCFLTVDLYESKDPAQVLQCIEAFSRVASGIAPDKIPKAVGNRKSVISPQVTGGSSHSRGRSGDVGGPASGRASPVKRSGSPLKGEVNLSPTGATSSGATSNAPAWNYAQYGWTGGASQGNQGISFGARRQLVSAAPHVPSIAEKERRRKEKAEEEERQRLEQEEQQRRQRAEREAEEQRAQEDEERRWADETRRMKEKEKEDAEAERRRWQDEERRWRQEEEKRAQEEKETEDRLEKERLRKAAGEKRLQGQYLSQYQAQEKKQMSEADRIRDLERQLEEAKERERRYESDRQSLTGAGSSGAPRSSLGSVEATPEPELGEDSIQDSERDFLAGEWSKSTSQSSHSTLPSQSPRPLPTPQRTPAAAAPVAVTVPVPVPVPAPLTPSTRPLPSISSVGKSPRPLPTVASTHSSPFARPLPSTAAGGGASTQSSRPLPNPATYTSPAAPSPLSSTSTTTPNRTDRYLSSHAAPAGSSPAAHVPSEAAFSSTSEADAEAQRRHASQEKTRQGGWASKSLLEREMERERQRQREWEQGQQQTQQAVAEGRVDPQAGSGPGGSWDVHQYGYTGGDNLNKNTGGVYAGRRQILGPRPLGSKGGG